MRRDLIWGEINEQTRETDIRRGVPTSEGSGDTAATAASAMAGEESMLTQDRAAVAPMPPPLLQRCYSLSALAAVKQQQQVQRWQNWK
jgi:hypothetical protein